LPTPRGLSQAPTSFIGSWCQDIHRLPLVACHTTKNYKDARVHYAVLKIRAGTPTRPTTHRSRPTTEGKHTPATDPSRRFGEGRPQPHHHTNHNPQGLPVGAASDPEKPEQPETSRPARFLRTQQRASTIHSTPSTFHTHTPKDVSSTSFSDSAARLMVNVPQSEAPPPQDRRLRNGE
jgi:hypothetical protein